MAKRSMCVVLLACLLFSLLAMNALAAEQTLSGSCGESVQWSFDEASGILTISGEGEMEDYWFDAPWLTFGVNVTALVVEEGVTGIGDYAFYSLVNLRTLELPASLVSIGTSAFSRCDKLVYIVMPAGLSQVEMSAFSGCDALCHVLYLGTEGQKDEISVALGNTDLTGAHWHTEAEDVQISTREICTGFAWQCSACQEDIHLDAQEGTSHSFGEWETDKEVTCTENGSRSRACAACGISQTQTLYATGHRYSLEVTSATCTQEGKAAYVCSVCGNCPEETVIPATGHVMGSWEQTLPPTTTAEGQESRSCIVCGETETRAVDKLPEESQPTEPTQPQTENPFVDVSQDKYYYDSVLWAYGEKITLGKDATHFQPHASCTRAQIVTFLWRAMGSPEPVLNINPFSDVTEDKYYYKAVIWAVQSGITLGKTMTTFAPDEPCTRGQAVTFLWRTMGRPVPQTLDNPFTDVADSAYYRYAVIWAYENQITLGKTATTFLPDETCTRAQIVTFLYRTLA